MSGNEPREAAAGSASAAAPGKRSGLLGYLPLAYFVPSFLFSSASESKLEALGGEAASSQRAGLPAASSFLRGERAAAQFGSSRGGNSGLSAPPSPSHSVAQSHTHLLDHSQEAMLSGGGHGSRQPPQTPHRQQQHPAQHPHDAAAAPGVSASPATSAGGAWGSRCPSVAGADVAGGGDPGGASSHHGTNGGGPGHGAAASPDPDQGSAVKTRGGGTLRLGQLSNAGGGGSGSGSGPSDADTGGAAGLVGSAGAAGGGGIGAAVVDGVRRSISSGLGIPSGSEHGGTGTGAGAGRGASNPSGKPPVRTGVAPGAAGAAVPAGGSQLQPLVSLFGMPLPRAPGSAGGGAGGAHLAAPPISLPGLNHRVRAASPKPRRVPSLSGPITPNGLAYGLAGANASAPKQPTTSASASGTAAAAAAVAAPRPSPGALIRYVLAPALLLPVAWPWLLLRLWYVVLCTAGVLAGGAIDAVGALVDLLRRHRAGAELLGGWAVAWLGWLLAAYWAGLAQLQLTAEDALAGLSKLAAPLAAALLRRYPALAAALQPLQAVVGAVTGSAYGAFCFVHDEIVPVALDLAERLPLVHMLLNSGP